MKRIPDYRPSQTTPEPDGAARKSPLPPCPQVLTFLCHSDAFSASFSAPPRLRVKATLSSTFAPALLALLTALAGCGYHVSGHGDMLPKTVQTIAIPAFGNLTSRYKLARTLPDRKSTRLNSSHADICTLSRHDALPILSRIGPRRYAPQDGPNRRHSGLRQPDFAVQTGPDSAHGHRPRIAFAHAVQDCRRPKSGGCRAHGHAVQDCRR